MLFIKNFALYSFDFGNNIELPLVHDYMDKIFVIVYGWFALCDSNILYRVVGDNGNDMKLEQLYEGICISNIMLVHDHLFYNDGITSELNVINIEDKITKVYSLNYNDLSHIKNFDVYKYVDKHSHIKILITTYIIDNKLVIQIILPHHTPKIICSENIIDFTYSVDNLYVIGTNNEVLTVKITDIIYKSTSKLNFSTHCDLESDCKLFAIYQDKRMQTNYIFDDDCISIEDFTISDDDDRTGIYISFVHGMIDVYEYTINDDENDPSITFYKITSCCNIYYCDSYVAVGNNDLTIDIYEQNNQSHYIKTRTIDGVLGCYKKNIAKSANNVCKNKNLQSHKKIET